MFAIEFKSDAAPHRQPSEPGSRYGQITLGDFRETFISVQTFWDAARYEVHWREALDRIVRDGRDSCLITSIAGPDKSHILFWWPLYRDGDSVLVQNSILFLDDLPERFNPERPFRSVPVRTTVSEDGDPISEWRVSVADVEAFARSAARGALASGQAPRRDVHTRPPA